MRRVRNARGAATAELAMVLPLLVAVALGLVWLLAVGAAQVRAVDAARETARALARGDDETTAVGRGQVVAPDGSRITVSRAGGEVRVTVTGTSRPGEICIMIAKVFHKTVRLDKPLGDREVVGSDGKRVPLEKAADQRMPETSGAR